MADITMCLNKKCPLKEKCYRFMARPSEYRQSYEAYKPDENGECVDFWER